MKRRYILSAESNTDIYDLKRLKIIDTKSDKKKSVVSNNTHLIPSRNIFNRKSVNNQHYNKIDKNEVDGFINVTDSNSSIHSISSVSKETATTVKELNGKILDKSDSFESVVSVPSNLVLKTLTSGFPKTETYTIDTSLTHDNHDVFDLTDKCKCECKCININKNEIENMQSIHSKKVKSSKSDSSVIFIDNSYSNKFKYSNSLDILVNINEKNSTINFNKLDKKFETKLKSKNSLRCIII